MQQITAQTVDELVTIREVAKKFGRKYGTVLDWHKKGKLAAWKIGGTWYTTWAAVDEMGQSKSPVPTPEEQSAHQAAVSQECESYGF